MNSNETIKTIYDSVLKSKINILNDIRISKFETVSEYLETVYDIVMNGYNDELRYSAELMGITLTEMHQLLKEVVYINLYSDFVVIEQLMQGKGLQKHEYLYDLQKRKPCSAQTIDRIKKRLTKNRLTSNKEFVFSTIDGDEYYVPSVQRMYKEILFIPRTDTKILDISSAYIDIFESLFYDTDKQVKDNAFIADRDVIKNYRIWDINEGVLEKVVDIYKTVHYSDLQGDKIAQLIFLEKAFGLYNTTALIRKSTTRVNRVKFAKAICQLKPLGYSKLHESIIEKIDAVTANAYFAMIDNFIYPAVKDVWKMVLISVIKYTNHLEQVKKVEFVRKCKNVCCNFTTKGVEQVFTKTGFNLKGTTGNCVNTQEGVVMVKTLSGLEYQKTEQENFSEYIKIGTRADYSLDEKYEERYVVDIGLTDLNY